MTSPIVPAASRRRFLQYLAGSPLFAPGAISAYAKEATVQAARPDDLGASGRRTD